MSDSAYDMKKECDAMTTTSKLVLIEISEEAYKQNTIYRPWVEYRSADVSTSAATSVATKPTRQTRQLPTGDDWPAAIR